MDIKNYPSLKTENLKRINRDFKAEKLHPKFFGMLNAVYKEYFEALEEAKGKDNFGTLMAEPSRKVKIVTIAAREALSLSNMYQYFINGAERGDYAHNQEIYDISLDLQESNIRHLLSKTKEALASPTKESLNGFYTLILDDFGVARSNFIDVINDISQETLYFEEGGDMLDSDGFTAIDGAGVADSGSAGTITRGKKNNKSYGDFKAFKNKSQKVKKHRKNKRKKAIRDAIKADHEFYRLGYIPGTPVGFIVILILNVIAVYASLFGDFNPLMLLGVAASIFIGLLATLIASLSVTKLGYSRSGFILFLTHTAFFVGSVLTFAHLNKFLH